MTSDLGHAPPDARPNRDAHGRFERAESADDPSPLDRARQALADARQSVGELWDHASRLARIEMERVMLTVRRGLVLAAAGILAVMVGTLVVASGIVLICVGAGRVLADAWDLGSGGALVLGGTLLLTGFAVLGGLGAVFWKRRLAASAARRHGVSPTSREAELDAAERPAAPSTSVHPASVTGVPSRRKTPTNSHSADHVPAAAGRTERS